MTARIAVPTVNLRLDGDFLAFMELGHVSPTFHDLAGYLVPLCHRIFGKWVFAVVNMDVRSTDTDFHDLYKHLVIADFRDRYFLKNDLSWFCHYLLKHSWNLLSNL